MTGSGSVLRGVRLRFVPFDASLKIIAKWRITKKAYNWASSRNYPLSDLPSRRVRTIPYRPRNNCVTIYLILKKIRGRAMKEIFAWLIVRHNKEFFDATKPNFCTLTFWSHQRWSRTNDLPRRHLAEQQMRLLGHGYLRVSTAWNLFPLQQDLVRKSNCR